ncbi:MAG: PTS sugar transporter subunit IIA [Treponema sp.]|jgi:PTS system nitrogen regulatory IIA component|nr:PTS sugar transporter subunit IIA [Treponema sp.]
MDNDIPLSTLIERGGIFREVAGNSVDSVLTEFIGLLPGPFSPERDGDREFRTALVKAALEREALMSTSIGRGIALPHPRNPMAADEKTQFVAVGFPALPVDWKALDGKPVHSVLLIVSASSKFHLRTLSKINFFCTDEKFLSLLRDRAPSAVILQTIREAEQGWKQ